MRKVSGGSRRMGGSGSRGISRGSSGGFKMSSGRKGFSSGGYRGINRHHSYYGRQYGTSIIPLWVRVVFFIIIMIMALATQ